MEKPTPQDIFSTFAATADVRKNNTAIVYLGTQFSYLHVKGLAERFAAALTDMGVATGQKVVLYIPNSIQWIVSWLGIQKIGAVAVPITPIYTPQDLKYIATDSEAEAIVCADTNFGYVTTVLSETPIKRVIVTKMADLLPWWKRYFGHLFDVIPRGKITLDETTYSFRKLLSTYRNKTQNRNRSNTIHRRNDEIPQGGSVYP
jgi:long-chain acyl-CoA synthetase